MKDQAVFIVANEHEAGLIANAGYDAIAVGGLHADELRALASELEDRTAILALDAIAEKRINRILQGMRIRCRRVVDVEEARDAFANADEAGLVNLCKRECEAAIANRVADKGNADRALLKGLGVHDSGASVAELLSGAADREKIPTGLKNLDAILDGGLPTGALTTLGALSSLGKTTLCLNIANHIAMSGRHVLFVTLEQSRYELHAMGIARMMCIESRGRYKISRAAIQSAKRREAWSPELKAFYERIATTEYARVAMHLHILEADEQPTARDIVRASEAMSEIYGQPPIIIVDYLQLIKAEDPRRDERLAINDSISTLRKLARDMGTCVLLISALSRASMSEGVTQSAFRESSGIEYSSDLQLGLQPLGMAEEIRKSTDKTQRKTAIEVLDNYRDDETKQVEIRVLKNRAGSTPKEGAHLTFDAKCSYFHDAASDLGKDARFAGVRKL